MTSSKCALCDVEITKDNNTKEHIIPNAIGGRKKVENFICEDCNKKSGRTWDIALINQLEPFSLLFDIKRERGEVKPNKFTTTKGEKITLRANGTMTLGSQSFRQTPIESGGTHFSGKAQTMSQAKDMLKSMKKKHPDLDIDSISGSLKENSIYCEDEIVFDISFGGHEAGRSLVKSAVAWAFESGISLEDCDEAIYYLKNPNAEKCFGYFYKSDLVKNRTKGVPIHCISVKGCSKKKQLIAYIEYFGTYRIIIRLGSNYQGKDTISTYGINPMTGQTIDLKVDINLSDDEIIETYNYQSIFEDKIEEALFEVISTAQQLSWKKEADRVADISVNEAFKQCGVKEGEALTDENKRKFVDSILNSETLNSFRMHGLKNKD
ncbi:HNH endonuclease [Psychrobacter pocilloporae]|uniref:HNH endonuclease 5 domain-containing protein n=1 Tax=Psychrobacter piscatorii TaxID=554343 RepID=A0A0T6DRK1_9GAMM|nr:HNH endonuclease [Psychrobacter piscatorii]KRU22296.1 hypothetical protein AS194_09105 [Psychrobacter piscatorii]